MKDGQDDSDSEESESSSSSPASSADDRIARVIKSKGKHAFPDVWKILRKELNWKCVNDSKGISVHVAPWSGGMVGNTRFQATPDDQVNRSYFYEKDDLLRYLKKYGPNKVESDPTPPEPLGRVRLRGRARHLLGPRQKNLAMLRRRGFGPQTCAAWLAGPSLRKREPSTFPTDWWTSFKFIMGAFLLRR